MLTRFKGKLWADIFAPKRINQLIGNSVNIKKFKEWMFSWGSAERNNFMKLAKTNKKKKPKTKDGIYFCLF
jgi:hypothetical protein